MISENYKIPFAEVVKHLFKLHGIETAKEVEAATGVSEGTLKPFFAGTNKYLNVPNMVVISDYLGVSISTMLEMARQGELDEDRLERKLPGTQSIMIRRVTVFDPIKEYEQMVRSHINKVKEYMAIAIPVFDKLTGEDRKIIRYLYGSPAKYNQLPKHVEAFIYKRNNCKPDILEGDTILVDMEGLPSDGDLVFFHYKGKDCCGNFAIDMSPDDRKIFKIKCDHDHLIYRSPDDIKNFHPIFGLRRGFKQEPGISLHTTPDVPKIMPPESLKE